MADLWHGTGRYRRSDRLSARTQTEDRFIFSGFTLPSTLPTLRASAKLISLPTKLGSSEWGYGDEALNGVFYQLIGACGICWCLSCGSPPVPMLNSSKAHGKQSQRDQNGHQSTTRYGTLIIHSLWLWILLACGPATLQSIVIFTAHRCGMTATLHNHTETITAWPRRLLFIWFTL